MQTSEIPVTRAADVWGSWRERSFLLSALAIGASLRLVWGQDIEFKHDEMFMFERAMRAGVSEPLPWIGMPSGAGTPNPGLSIWLFVGMAKLFAVRTPPGLARVVQSMNVLALVFATALAYGMMQGEERRSWLWGVALACVNPLAVVLHRKLWAQSALPLVCVLFIAAWYRRHTRAGAFFWGLLGVLLGQIHMAGFFLGAAVWLWTWMGARLAPVDADSISVRWRAWTIGSLVGSLTLIPWFAYLVKHGTNAHSLHYLDNLVSANFYGAWYWILWWTGSLGLGLSYSLGATDFGVFLKYPMTNAGPTYLIAVAHVVLLTIGLWVVVTRIVQLRARVAPSARTVLGGPADSVRLTNASLFGLGTFLTVLGYPIFRHYLAVTFPLEWVWLARQTRLVTRRSDLILGVTWLCQLTIAVAFLYYIHVNHGAVSGDYGSTYGSQR